MSCSQLQSDLVGFHFGEVTEDTRSRIEEHLLGCRDCLSDFLSLKRAIEAPDLTESPSDTMRARLRHSVAEQVGTLPATRPWAWWERPAAVALASAAMVAALFFLQLVATGPGSMPHSLADQVHQPSTPGVHATD